MNKTIGTYTAVVVIEPSLNKFFPPHWPRFANTYQILSGFPLLGICFASKRAPALFWFFIVRYIGMALSAFQKIFVTLNIANL